MSWIEDYVDYAKNNEVPEHFHWWTGLTILGAALRRNVTYKRGRFRIFPNIWIIIVSPAGCKKTTALDMGYNILSKLDNVKLLPDRFTPEILCRSLGKKEEDGRIESQAVLYAPELGVMLDKKHFNEGLIQLLLRFWDCPEDWTYETITGGSVPLKNVAITLMGAVADDIFKESMPEMVLKSGFLSRVLVITGKDEGKVEPFPWTDDIVETDIITSLYELSLLKGEMIFGSKAQEWYVNWYIRHKSKLRNTIEDKIRAYYERKPKYLFQIGMLCSISKYKRLEFTIDGFEQAEEKLNSLEPGLIDLCQAIDATPLGKNQIRILEQMRKRGGRITHIDLLKKNYNLMTEPTLFKRIMTHLLETGVIKVGRLKNGELVYELKEDI